MAAKRFQTLYFELGGITKHLMTGPSGNSEFCFPSSLNVPLGFASGNIEVSGKQNSLFPLGPVIKCLITLIDKKDKDRTLLGNWRPISLLNVDVKLLSKALAYRIKKKLPKIIHSNQSGYVEGRFIGETIRTIDDIMEFTKCEGIGGILAFLDFEKAFDSVEWNFFTQMS